MAPRWCCHVQDTHPVIYALQAGLAKALCNSRGEVGSTLGQDFGGAAVVTHSSRVLAAGRDWLELERPLHLDVALEFGPEIFT